MGNERCKAGMMMLKTEGISEVPWTQVSLIQYAIYTSGQPGDSIMDHVQLVVQHLVAVRVLGQELGDLGSGSHSAMEGQ